jgi:NDP-sugar pyrophosphorylase family protein
MNRNPLLDPEAYLDLTRTRHGVLFAPGEPVWTALERIAAYLAGAVSGTWIAPGARVSPKAEIGERVRIGEGTVVEAFATIRGPAWIGDRCTVRAGAYLREHVLAGDGVMFGNSCEFKNCWLFDEAEVPHFNYVGDSILGHRAHLGAGAVLSNVRLDRGPVRAEAGGERWVTGLRKFGAVIGDRTEIGCHSVLSPGSLVGRDCVLYPGSLWRGHLPSGHVVKTRAVQEVVPRRET